MDAQLSAEELAKRFEGVSPAPGDNPNSKQVLRVEGDKAAWEC